MSSDIEKLYVPPELRTNRTAPRIFAAIMSVLGLSFSIWGILEMKREEPRTKPLVVPRDTPEIDKDTPEPILINMPNKTSAPLENTFFQILARGER